MFEIDFEGDFVAYKKRSAFIKDIARRLAEGFENGYQWGTLSQETLAKFVKVNYPVFPMRVIGTGIFQEVVPTIKVNVYKNGEPTGKQRHLHKSTITTGIIKVKYLGVIHLMDEFFEAVLKTVRYLVNNKATVRAYPQAI